ncbi:hypothetical protein KIPB_006520 [Kipferlia bialata]|uniref:Uncharacterized protein n=1 Tax=Kipferlia bialata TaxID=797122 RepID=A0A9K3CYQ9_9EUKA|nr:hypothetical protein KIPB_006520 [Kipferlia bialata]|eukprot:g6520.t1
MPGTPGESSVGGNWDSETERERDREGELVGAVYESVADTLNEVELSLVDTETYLHELCNALAAHIDPEDLRALAEMRSYRAHVVQSLKGQLDRLATLGGPNTDPRPTDDDTKDPASLSRLLTLRSSLHTQLVRADVDAASAQHRQLAQGESPDEVAARRRERERAGLADNIQRLDQRILALTEEASPGQSRDTNTVRGSEQSDMERDMILAQASISETGLLQEPATHAAMASGMYSDAEPCAQPDSEWSASHPDGYAQAHYANDISTDYTDSPIAPTTATGDGTHGTLSPSQMGTVLPYPNDGTSAAIPSRTIQDHPGPSKTRSPLRQSTALGGASCNVGAAKPPTLSVVPSQSPGFAALMRKVCGPGSRPLIRRPGQSPNKRGLNMSQKMQVTGGTLSRSPDPTPKDTSVAPADRESPLRVRYAFAPSSPPRQEGLDLSQELSTDILSGTQ